MATLTLTIIVGAAPIAAGLGHSGIRKPEGQKGKRNETTTHLNNFSIRFRMRDAGEI